LIPICGSVNNRLTTYCFGG